MSGPDCYMDLYPHFTLSTSSLSSRRGQTLARVALEPTGELRRRFPRVAARVRVCSSLTRLPSCLRNAVTRGDHRGFDAVTPISRPFPWKEQSPRQRSRDTDKWTDLYAKSSRNSRKHLAVLQTCALCKHFLSR